MAGAALTLRGWGNARKRGLAGLGQTVRESASLREHPHCPLSPSAPQSTVQSYLEGVSAGLEQLRSAVQEVQSVCQELGAARWALLDCADRFQDLQQMRALMAEHVQLASVVQVLPQLFSGKAPAQCSWVWGGRHSGVFLGLFAGLVARLEQVAQALLIGFGKSPWMEMGWIRPFPLKSPCYPMPMVSAPAPLCPLHSVLAPLLPLPQSTRFFPTRCSCSAGSTSWRPTRRS